jgi:hypothetical protein
MLQVTPQATAVWPVPGDATGLTGINKDQAIVMRDQAALIDAYQSNLNKVQATTPTTATGTATGTQLALTGVTNGPVKIGATVTGTGVTVNPPTTIIGQSTGTTGTDGTYLLNQASTAGNAAITITPGGGPSNWPTQVDSPTLMSIQQAQTLILRTQTTLLQQYQSLLNISAVPAPPSGP